MIREIEKFTWAVGCGGTVSTAVTPFPMFFVQDFYTISIVPTETKASILINVSNFMNPDICGPHDTFD